MRLQQLNSALPQQLGSRTPSATVDANRPGRLHEPAAAGSRHCRRTPSWPASSSSPSSIMRTSTSLLPAVHEHRCLRVVGQDVEARAHHGPSQCPAQRVPSGLPRACTAQARAGCVARVLVPGQRAPPQRLRHQTLDVLLVQQHKRDPPGSLCACTAASPHACIWL